jgi:hypothetical protein
VRFCFVMLRKVRSYSVGRAVRVVLSFGMVCTVKLGRVKCCSIEERKVWCDRGPYGSVAGCKGACCLFRAVEGCQVRSNMIVKKGGVC